MLTRARFIATAASGAALALGLGGCSFLGIEDPSAADDEDDADALPAGSVDFDSLVVSLNTDATTWQWSKILDANSDLNGELVVGLPASAQNNDDAGRVLSSYYCSVVAPDGTTQGDLPGTWSGDILEAGNIPAGSSTSGTLYVLIRGSGTYTVALNDHAGTKAEITVTIDPSVSGLLAIPDQLGAYDVADAVPSGSAFDVRGLTLLLSADTLSYCWLQASAPGDPVWDGRWCVGVPTLVTNNSTAPAAVTQDIYAKFAPGLYLQDDPAPYFAAGPYVDADGNDGMNDVATIGLLNAGESKIVMVWWVYDYDGDYYVVYDNHGAKTIATAHIAQYE